MMTETPPKPKRDKRRIIVAFLLLSAGFFIWWIWLSNSRFVGKWAYGMSADGKPLQIWHLTRGGFGWVEQPSDGSQLLTKWHVDGSTLKMGYVEMDEVLRFRLWLHSRGGKRPHFMGGSVHKLHEVGPDSIVIQRSDSLLKETIVRLPE